MLQVNVAQLHDDNREALALVWVAGREGGTAVRREAAASASLIDAGIVFTLERWRASAPAAPHRPRMKRCRSSGGRPDFASW